MMDGRVDTDMRLSPHLDRPLSGFMLIRQSTEQETYVPLYCSVGTEVVMMNKT